MPTREPNVPFSSWRPLSTTEVERVPACPGVFELATLVRTVIFIGHAPDDLHETLGQHVLRHLRGRSRVPHAAGRLYFRFCASDDGEAMSDQLLDAFRRAHGNTPPAAQTSLPAPPARARHLKVV